MCYIASLLCLRQLCKGVIYEEAKQKCGGAEALQGAVDRGDVRVMVQKGVKFYVFPNIRVGHSEEALEQQSIERGKDISSETFGVLSDFVRDMGWVVTQKGEGRLATSASSGSSEALALDNISHDELEHMREKMLDVISKMEKVHKAGEKLVPKLKGLPGAQRTHTLKNPLHEIMV